MAGPAHDSTTPAGDLPDPALPAGTDRVPQVAHVVVLMMENHSYDNYLGTLGRGDGLPDPGPVNLAQDGRPVTSHRMPSPRQVPRVPSQSWPASHEQYAQGGNDGFVASVEHLEPTADASLAMGYWTERDLPFYASLARTFPLADRWFCSCLGPTFPNRRFLIAGTANGLIDDAVASIIDYPKSGTIFDSLDRHGIDWANYHHVPGLRLLRHRAGGRGVLRFVRTAALLGRQLVPGMENVVRGEIRCTANLYPLGLRRTRRNVRHIREFFARAAVGALPPFCIVDPDFERASEENPQDVRLGEGFAAAVVNAVMSGPAWGCTLLIWLYDEHGGYYDHVPPPAAPEPDDVLPHSLVSGNGPLGWVLKHLGVAKASLPAHSDGRYDRYGFRVPAVVVSPFARPDHVSSTVYDHTSVLKLIEEKWNLPPLTRRDAAATAPWDMLDFDNPPAFLTPPPLASPCVPWQP
ncbi:MAG TPA: alkaline phosphatase family protein [Acidimicrobiales bacterium]|nr:alkaline phosphatase family protein [Acidimicrobiales bacterium]